MHVWNVLHAVRWKYRTLKFAICAPSYNCVGLYLSNQGLYRQSEKNSAAISPPDVPIIWLTYGLLTAEIGLVVWGTPANFNGFRVLAALLHGTPAVGVYIVWSWPWQILGTIRAEARAGERVEILFFLSGKQPAISRTFGLPNFAKFAHKTWIYVAMNPFGKHLWKFARKGSFPKRSTFAWTLSATSDFRPRYLRN